MPRYPMTTYLSETEIAQVNQTCKDEGLLRNGKPNYYAFMKKAALAFCEACKKEKKQDDRKPEGKGDASRESPETVGKTESSNRSAEQQDNGATNTLPEARDYTAAVNHADPEDIGF